MLYRTLVSSYANYQENKSFKFMEGTFDYFQGSDVYFAFFNGNEELSTMPEKTSGLSFNEAKSSCTNGASIIWNEELWAPKIINLSTTKTKCTLYFDKVASPELYEGLIPIKFNNKEMITANTSTEWYNYDEHEWANAVLVNYEDTTIRNKYFNSDNSPKIDIEVDINDVLQMYVWIPRYKYLLWNAENGTSEPQAIDIQFVSNDVTNPSVKKEEDYKNGEWLVHPAFTFGETELSGIWVGKFEMSGTTSVPTILPNKQSLTNINVSTMFNTLQGMTNAKYGISKSESDTYMMKNSEWGAVAYLSHSIYGRYNADKTCISSGCEVWINNVNTGYGYLGSANYTGQPIYGPSITGCTGLSANAQATPNKTTCEENYDWENFGVNASTSGNITGIYDMVGGAWEYVMGVMYDSDGVSPRYQGSGFNSSAMPNSKYYDTYAYQESDGTTGTTAESSIARYHLGEGTRETLTTIAVNTKAGWYTDFNYILYSSEPWVCRGSAYNDSTSAGLFDFRHGGGFATAYYSFRATLTSK